jgi:L-ascorbate metabolism protein UlaG (beta-lactamase superfamily)
MEITYLGHSSFKIKGKTATVITDPFDSKMVGLKYPRISADIVTVSHSHGDHNKTDLIDDCKKVIEGPGEYEVMGVSIIGLRTWHDGKKGDERGNNTIYVFEIDGLRVVHLGDLGHELGNETMEMLGSVDVLMIPVGGFFTISVTQACDLVRNIESKIVIPMHFLAEGMNMDNFGKISKLDSFLSEVGLNIEKTEKLSLKLTDLTEDMQKVVVLENKFSSLKK